MTNENIIDENQIQETIRRANEYAEFADRNLIPPGADIRAPLGTIDPAKHLVKIMWLFPLNLQKWETETLLGLSINPEALAQVVETYEEIEAKLDSAMREEFQAKIALLESDREKGRKAIRESKIWERLSPIQAAILKRIYLGDTEGDESFAA